LTTTITSLDFHPSGQILSIGSKWAKNALRLVHIPSYTTYQNFPGIKSGQIKFAFSSAFNKHGDYLAVGNDEGKVMGYHLSHFS